MRSDRKRPAARDSATSVCRKPRAPGGIEPLEPRAYFSAALGAAASPAMDGATAHSAIVVSAGGSYSTAQNLGAIASIDILRGSLTPTLHAQYFKFDVPSTSTVGVSLTHVTANVDLQLLKAPASGTSFQTLATSAHPGTTNESIGKKLSAGVYYARVFEAGGSARYTLALSSSTVHSNTNPPPPSTRGLHIVFDYRYDASGFFASHPAAKTLLNQAATAFARFTNVLTAIQPGNGDTWSESFPDPDGSGRQITLNNPSVAGNTVVIYVGASSNMQARELGVGQPGGWSAVGSENWINTVAGRGQAGALKYRPTATSPWGGSISFSAATNWNLSAAAPTSGQDDFLSVATHEIAHVLGFGTSDAWKTFVSGSSFIGSHSKAANAGKAIPLAPGLAHWANNFTSAVNGVSQSAEMDPYLVIGTRRAFTLLDYAGMQDIGWIVAK